MLLICKEPGGKEKKIRLKPLSQVPTVTIGRGKEASICLDDPRCSRIHCGIRYWDDIFVIRDMNSSNGTVVNGKPVDVARVSPGDSIKIGDTVIELVPEQSPTDATMHA